MEKNKITNNLFSFNPLPSWIYDLETLEILEVNHAAIQHYGYSRDEFLSLTLKDLRPPQEVSKLIDAHKDIENKEGNIYFGLFTHQKKNGSLIKTEINGHKVKFDDHQCMLVVCQDVSEKIEQEEKILQSEQRFKALVQEGADMISIIDVNGKYSYTSPTTTSILGITPEEFQGKTIFDFIHPDDIERASSYMQQISREQKVVVEPFRLRNAKNEWRWIETVLTNMLDNPAVKGIVANSRDITEKVNAQKQSEANEIFNRTVLESSPDCVKILNTEGRLQYMNYNGLCLMEIDEFSKFKDKAWTSLWGIENETMVKASLKKALAGETTQFTAFCHTAKGTPKWWDVLVSPVGDPGETVKQIISVSRDITKQKEEELKLKLLSSVITNTNDAVLITEAQPFDEPGPRIIYVNEAFTKMTGYTAEEVIGKSPRILQGPNSNKHELAKLGKALRNWESCEITTINYKKNGEEFWINFSVSPVADEKGWYTHWIAIERDVTEQKQKEFEKELLGKISLNFSSEKDMLSSSKLFCQTICDYGQFDFVELWLPNIENTLIQLIANKSASSQADKFYESCKQVKSFKIGEGLPGEVWNKKTTLLWKDLNTKEDFARKEAAKNAGIQTALAIPLRFNDQIVGVLLVASRRELDYVKKYVKLFQQFENFIGSELNRKKLENDLKHLYKTIPDILCVADFQGRFLKMNNGGCELLGFSEEELLYHTFDEFIHPDDKEISNNELNKLLEGESTFRFENRYITKKGQTVWLSWTCNSVAEEQLIYATAKNITDEKKQRELNRQTRQLAKIGSWEIDLIHQKIYWSEEVHQLHETDPTTFTPDLETAINFYREDFRAMVESNIERSITTGETIEFEGIIVTANKKEVWVRAIGNTEVFEGKCQRIYGSFQNIHERKESELRLKSITDDLPGVTFQYIISPDGSNKMQSVSKAAYDIWNLSPQECEQNNDLVWDQIKKSGDLEDVQQSIHESISKNKKWNFQWRNVMPNGELHWHEGYGTPNKLVDGTIVFNSLIFDITEKKEAVLLYNETAKIAQIGSWEFDLLSDTVYLSKIAKEIYELEEDIDITMSQVINLYREDYRDFVKETFDLAISKGAPWDFEAPITTPYGNECWVRAIGQVQIVEGINKRIFGSIQNIHERKLGELRLKSLSDDLPGVAFQYCLFPDGKDQFLTVSKGSEKIWKLSPEECVDNINLVWDQIKKGGDFDAVVADITNSIETKTQWHSKWRNIWPNGEVRWHEGYGTPYLQADGSVLYNSMVFDKTDEYKAVELYDETSTLARIGSWELILNGQEDNDKMYWSPIVKEILEVDLAYDPSLTAGLEFYVGDSKEKISEGVENLIATGEIFDLELQIKTAENNIKWIRCIGKADFYNGICKRIYGSYQDIHKRKIAEIQLKALTDNLPGAIFQYVLHPDGKDEILYISEGSHKVWGMSPEECKLYTEKIWQQIEAGGDIASMQDSIQESARDLTMWRSEWRNISPDGTVRYFEGQGMPQRLEDGSTLWHSLVLDITERKIFEENYLAEQAERINILESISDAFYGLDENWNFTYFNKEAENLLNKKSEDVLNNNIWEVFYPAKGTIIEEKYRKVVATGISETFEYCYPGDESWYEINAYPSNDGLSAFFKNIDDRKKAAEELQKAYKEKNNILESIGDAFFAVNKNWIVTYWNKEAESVMGIKREEIVGEKIWEVYTDAIDSDFYRQYHKAMESGEDVEFEEYYPTNNKWFAVSVYPSQEGLSIYFKDVTLRKEADIRLIQANERFEKVTEATSDAIWDWDIVDNSMYWGEGFKKLFGYDVNKESPSRAFWKDHLHPEDLEGANQSLHKVLNSNTNNWTAEYRYRKVDDTYAIVIDRGIIIRNANGKPVRMVGAMTDITEQRKQEKQMMTLNQSLKAYAKELEQSNEELEQFAFVTSHDLQEPLRMISSFMDQLKRKYGDELDEKALQYISYATDGAKRMKRIILDLLEFSRAGKPLEGAEKIDLIEILSDYKQLRRKLIMEKKVKITYSQLPSITTHKAGFEQVLHSLLDNAIKYTKDGVEPEIEINVEDKENDWEISIRDNGIGIDPEFFDKIFIIFQRLHNRSKFDGTGIGLSIAKRHVEYLGGNIWLESDLGQGSTFYFTIPKPINSSPDNKNNN